MGLSETPSLREALNEAILHMPHGLMELSLDLIPDNVIAEVAQAMLSAAASTQTVANTDFYTSLAVISSLLDTSEVRPHKASKFTLSSDLVDSQQLIDATRGPGKILLSHGTLEAIKNIQNEIPSGGYSISIGDKCVAHWIEFTNRSEELGSVIIIKALPETDKETCEELTNHLASKHSVLFTGELIDSRTLSTDLSLTFTGEYPFYIRIADQTKSEEYKGSAADCINIFNPDIWIALVTTENFNDKKRGELVASYAGLQNYGLRSVALFPFYIPDRSSTSSNDLFMPDRKPDAALIVEFSNALPFDKIASSSHLHSVKSAALVVPRDTNARDKIKWVNYAHRYFESLFGPRPDEPNEGMGVGVPPIAPTPLLVGPERKEAPVIYIQVPEELPAVGALRA